MSIDGGLDRQFDEIAGRKFHCYPCKDEGLEREAVGLCVDCQDHLCRRCFDSHTIPKPSRNHQLLEDHQQMPLPESPLTQTLAQSYRQLDRSTEPCPHHENQTIEYYCASHCQLCCTVCLNLDHRTCGEALYIPHIAKDLASNEEYKQAEEEMKEVLKKTKQMTEDVKSSSEKLENSFTESLMVVKQFRRVMNSMLDKAEAQIIEDAKEMMAENLKQLTNLTERYQRAEQELEATQAKIDTLQKSGQTCNMYIEMMKSQTKTKTLEAQITTAEKEHFYRKRQIKFSPNPEILDQIRLPEAFGKVSEEGTVARVEYLGHIFMKTGADRYNCAITGCVVLPDNRVVTTDYANGTIKVVDVRNNHPIIRKKLRNLPWDVAMISGKQVVITMPFVRQLAFISVADGINITGTLTIDGNCYGIDYRDDVLAVSCCEPHEVHILDLQGKQLHRINTDKIGFDIFNYPLYVSIGLDNKTLYVTNNLNNTLMRTTFDGTVVASYSDDQLVDPRKATIDHSGNVYICAYGSHSVHQITPDCKKIGELMSFMDGLSSPFSISFSEGENKLYVGMPDDTIRVYQTLLESE